LNHDSTFIIAVRIKEGNKEQDILDAGIKVFAAAGFHQAKISKIAETAGIATGSVYLYFSNKTAILQRIFENLWKELNSESSDILIRDDINALEKLEHLIDLVCDKFYNDPLLAIVIVNEQHNLFKDDELIPPIYKQFLDKGESIIIQGQKNGLIDNSLSVKVLRHLIIGSLKYLIDLWAKKPEEVTMNELRRNVKKIFIAGIRK